MTAMASTAMGPAGNVGADIAAGAFLPVGRNDLLTEAATTATRLDADPQRQRALRATWSATACPVRTCSATPEPRWPTPNASRWRQSPPPNAARGCWSTQRKLGHDSTNPDRAYQTLLAAERTAPGEVRTRNALRRLVGDLLASPKQAAMPQPVRPRPSSPRTRLTPAAHPPAPPRTARLGEHTSKPGPQGAGRV